MRHLSNREVRTINAIAEVLVPQGGAFSSGFKDVDIISFVEDFLSKVPLRVRIFVYVNLWLFEYFSWIAIMNPWIFSKMSLINRETILRLFRKNRWFAIRGIYMFISIILLMSFYHEKKVMDAIGYYGYKENINKLSQSK